MPMAEELAPLDAQPTVRTTLDEVQAARPPIQGVDALTASLAHDFNDILSAILVNGHFLLDGMDADDPRCEEVEEICSAAERGAALTQRLLAFSRRQILQPSLVDLNGLVRTIERSLRRFAGTGIDLVLRLAPGLGTVKADRRQLEQAITNLVINAAEAMPSGGRLVVETANAAVEALDTVGPAAVVPGDYVSLAVSDSGRGMDAATRERAFEPFFTTKERGRGLGLGLSTVYTTVDQVGGYVSLHSQPGRGTAVALYLPRVQAAAVQEPIAVTDLALVGTESILLVDDDAGVRNAVGRILTARGYRVLMARSGDEAIELASRRDRPIDLLLTDLLIPGMHGPEIARKLSTIEPAPRVLFMSGYTDHAVLGDGSDGVQYLQKPFAPEALLRKVRDVLDQPRPPAVKAD
jgi:nitrogen-specific signal transduction histidine kinase